MVQYNVGTIREAGLEAKWTRTRKGAPIIVARDPTGRHKHQRETWWFIDRRFWEMAQEVGIVEAFDRITMLGDFFSV